MKYIKTFRLFESTLTISYEDIISKYFSENSDIYNTYRFKWIISKYMEYYKKLDNNTDKSGLDTLSKYIDKISSSKESILLDYSSDWINFLSTKIPEGTLTYPQLVSKYVKKLKGKNYNFGSADSLITTNIKIFKEILSIVNSKLPKQYQFDFGVYKSISTIDNKDLLKCIIYFNILNDDNLSKWIDHLNKMNQVINQNDEYFIKYMLDNFNINITKASTSDDIKGIDFIADDGTTYQLKYASNLVKYDTGYFIPNTSQLDIKSINVCDKLALYDKSKRTFIILTITDIDFIQKENGLFIKPKKTN